MPHDYDMGLNYFLYRFKYRYGKFLPLAFPVDVSLELSSLCNMACSYCYHSDPEKLPFKRGFMDFPTAHLIISESAKLGVNSLKFNWKGESTLNPNFNKITRRAKDMASGAVFIDRLSNSNFKFPTNRTDIFEGLCNQTKVKVSYDSFDARVFESQRTRGNHDLTTRNIDTFHDWPNRKNTEIVIQAVRTSANKDEDIASLAARRWPDASISIRDMVGGRVDKDLSKMTVKSRDNSERQACQQAFVRLIFNHAGNAFPCCPDVKEELKLGNIWDDKLEDIFHGAAATKLRADLKSKKAFDSDPCKSCSSFETFKGYKPSWDS